MRIKKMNRDFSVCRVADYTLVNLNADYCFIEKTEEENSLVCMTEDVPANTTEREDGWKAFRIEGVLDFSLIGILAGIAGVLAEHGISIFAVSTYNTDYVLIKRESYGKALEILGGAGYEIVE
ncbi:MAG TPA: ACT domain-containing protein [Candidatus Lachnoclostridium avicola]|nr:ACT domain-containing protein [Candidatus Lachnoclostridium avicola]